MAWNTKLGFSTFSNKHNTRKGKESPESFVSAFHTVPLRKKNLLFEYSLYMDILN